MRAIVTGASSGIGAALCREIARRHPGATLLLIARREAPMRALAAALPGVRCECVALDVTDAPALRRALAAFVDAGTPDLVIANAGISAGTHAGCAADRAVFARIVDVNLIALVETLGACVGSMKAAARGSLVGIASVAGVRGLPGSAAYSASKAGVIAALESLRIELRGSGVAVVTIVPGFVRTPMTDANPFPMPFMLDADTFARRALDAIAARRRFAVIPWPMHVVATLLRWMPSALYDRIAATAPRKPRPDPGGTP